LQRRLLFDRLLASCRGLGSGSALVTLRSFAPPDFRRASSLLRTVLTSRTLSWARSPRVRCLYFRPVPSSSTWCVFRWQLDFALP